MYAIADQATEVIQRNELVRQGAMKPGIGISVSDDEVDEKELGDADLFVRDGVQNREPNDHEKVRQVADSNRLGSVA